MNKHQLSSALAGRHAIENVKLSEHGVSDCDGLHVRKLSVAERSQFFDMMKSETPNNEAYGFIMTAALVDNEGRKIFDDPETDGKVIVSDWPCDLVDDLVTQILKFSGIMKNEAQTDAAEPEKN